MNIYYLSITGNVKRFVGKLSNQSIEINPTNPYISVDKPYIIIAPTYDIEVTEVINEFIEHGNNLKHLKGVIGSGNLNFADLYIFTAKDLSQKYNVPLLHQFEMSGTEDDVNKVKHILEVFEQDGR